MRYNYLLLFLFSFATANLFSQESPKSFGKGKFKHTYVLSTYKDTIVIVDTLNHTVIKNRIPEIRGANFITENGLILARISDGEGLVSSKGKLLNGPYNRYQTVSMENGYILTGRHWSESDLGRIIFNSNGDTILCKTNLYLDAGQTQEIKSITETTLMEGYNHKTKRQEKGYLLKSGKWKTTEYLKWVKVVQK